MVVSGALTLANSFDLTLEYLDGPFCCLQYQRAFGGKVGGAAFKALAGSLDADALSESAIQGSPILQDSGETIQAA